MHLVRLPSITQRPKGECGPKELSWLQWQPRGCHPYVCVCVCAHSSGSAQALHTQHWRGASGPARCWGSCSQPDPPRQLLVLPRVPLALQFCAYTPKLHSQCTECLFMHNKWDASCLHTCTNSLTYIAHLCLLCDCPRKHQSKEGDTEHILPPKHKDIK